ncbi:DUF2975 domain-containing protein [Aurantiacibacter sp. MUD61]|uniref:DUF2975 domain-containing protein n=1 Tax=Aurantiacibacter sp. MUD61 TaxID=3009083 RepID=UPI0022F05E55|nr:DUF2975 domain-containing protein [Aurantiacibacter sp. MUD61]
MDTDNRPNDLLLAGGKALTVLMQGVLGIAAFALAIVIPVLLIFRETIRAELIDELGPQASDPPMAAAIAVLVLALVAVVMIFIFFGKLRKIISTVGDGDPFVPENADRLSVMAWLLLGVQLLSILIGGIGLMVAKWADEVEHADITIDAGLDFTGILMVIVLFILARVFRHGAEMRDDLEGTV